MAIASAWEAGWLISPGHPEVFRNREGEIVTFSYILKKKTSNKMDASFALIMS